MDSLPPRAPGLLYAPTLPLGEREVPWRRLDIAGVSTSVCGGQTVLRIQAEGDCHGRAGQPVPDLLAREEG